jgi:hypothetical protein
MNCPNCGAPEQARARVCQACGTAYASEDLLEYRQLEFLIKETEKWPEAVERSKPYADRLATLIARIRPSPPPKTAETALQGTLPQPMPQPAAPAMAPARETVKREPVPFDQWLLSERNIKIALFSGGALLVLAGLLFVGVNWARIPGPAKFAITLMVTGMMYLGGYLLFQRPTLRLGGLALLGIGCGFVPLNFVVLQVYIFSQRGLSANTMWLIASVPALLLYVLIAYWTRADLFTYLSLAAVASGVTATLVVLHAARLVYAPAYALLALVLLLGARAFQSTRMADFTRLPLRIVTQVAMPAIFVMSVVLWVGDTGCQACPHGNPWWALAAMIISVLFYLATDFAFHWLVARWAAAFTLAVTVIFVLTELRFSGTAAGISLMVLALVYLLVGYVLERRAGNRRAAWPLYAAGYAVAAFVTLQAIAAFGEDPDDLAKVLVGDVVLLSVSAWAHRKYEWVYGAAWAFIAPVSIYASLYLKGLANVGVVLGVLMLNYVAAGYALGRRELKLGGPFLTAGMFLSLAVVVLTWTNAVVASFVLGLVMVLYLLAALWRGWTWLLLPSLAAANLVVVTMLRIFFRAESPWEQTLTVIYTGLGVALTLGGAWLRSRSLGGWAWPMYLMGALDVAGSYIAGLALGGPIAIGLSLVFALVAFGVGWVERAALAKAKLPPVFTYVGAALIFVGHFYVTHLSGRAWKAWPAYAAGLCALTVALAWFLRRSMVKDVFGTPIWRAGVWLMVVPLGGALVIFEPLLAAVTFAIAAVIFAADATVRRILRLGYLAGGAFIIVIWAILLFFDVGELQAYAVPLGLALLALGWNERLRGGGAAFRWPTLLGLVILMGSAFAQSLDAVIYAVLLLAESMAAVAWGIRIRSRGYVQLGVLSLIANAVAQLGPSFVELPRWIQLGTIGGILLGGGLAGLFRREQLLATRTRLTDEWRRWGV